MAGAGQRGCCRFQPRHAQKPAGALAGSQALRKIFVRSRRALWRASSFGCGMRPSSREQTHAERGESNSGLAVAASLAATAGIAGALAASEGDPVASAAPTCRKAEVNPVIGHVLCIDPIGAPVAPLRQHPTFLADLMREPKTPGAPGQSARARRGRSLSQRVLDEGPRFRDAVKLDEGAEARPLRLAE